MGASDTVANYCLAPKQAPPLFEIPEAFIRISHLDSILFCQERLCSSMADNRSPDATNSAEHQPGQSIGDGLGLHEHCVTDRPTRATSFILSIRQPS